MRKFNRVWHPYEKWEEVKFGMWSQVKDRTGMYKEAVIFTGNHVLYGSYMFRVINEWPVSCENALTDYFMNRKAWIGHAASALAIGCPEDITRKAWKELSYEQQYLANKEASRAIRTWENNYIESKKLRKSVGEQMLF